VPGHLTYLVLETVWAIPVLALQWAVGRQALWDKRRILIVAIAVPTLYLSIADGFAIAHGIWRLHADRILGIRLGDLPIEEVLFFLLTNAMVAQSVVLVADRWKRV
jgi:lycopene beta-cyclase